LSFNLTKTDDWETPTDLLMMAKEHFKFEPTIDVCASAQNKKCPTFIRENALDMNWRLPFFMNCPYSKAKEWIYYAYEQHQKWNVSGLALLFVKTDTHAWHDCIIGLDKFGKPKAEILFIEGRVKFMKNGVPSKNSAPYPSAFVFWRSH
jgi:hypothetical protein